MLLGDLDPGRPRSLGDLGHWETYVTRKPINIHVSLGDLDHWET